MIFSVQMRMLLIFIFLNVSAVSQAKPLQEVTVGIDLWPGYYPLLLAQHNGYFEEQGLRVRYRLPEETNSLMDMFSSKQIDLLCVAMGDAFVLYDKDPEMRIVMLTDESSGGDALLKKGNLFKNKKPIKIGTNLKGFGELFVGEFLKSQNISVKDVLWVQQEASQAMEYLRTGKADIVHTWEPYVSQIVTYFGADIVFDSSQTPGLIPDALLATGQFIQQHPEELKQFIAAWLKAASWWKANRKEGDRIIEDKLLLLPGTLSLKGVKLYTAQDNQKAFSIQEGKRSIYQVVDTYKDFFKQKNTFQRLPETSGDILSRDFLPDAF